MAQEQRRHSETRQNEQTEFVDQITAGKQSSDAVPEQTHDLDSLLDEIDDVLEVNAEEFVQGFVQKGGQ